MYIDLSSGQLEIRCVHRRKSLDRFRITLKVLQYPIFLYTCTSVNWHVSILSAYVFTGWENRGQLLGVPEERGVP